MRIAIINEISAADKNKDILSALEGRGFEVLNLGNTQAGETPDLLYIHTGLMAALLLHLKAVDFVVGGCGTGIGFLNSVLQYPGVVCGHLLSPLDAFLFARINAGNCVSLTLNQGYGWAGSVNLRMIFDELFTSETGSGYPAHRAQPQKEGRELLNSLSVIAHKSFSEIVDGIPQDVVKKAIFFPAFKPFFFEFLKNDPDLYKVIHNISSAEEK